MKSFKDLGIEAPVQPFTGPKISIDDILNKTIKVLDYKFEKSKFAKHDADMRLTLHIEYEGKLRVVFSGSSTLKETIKKVSKTDFPFQTTIVETSNKNFMFQ